MYTRSSVVDMRIKQAVLEIKALKQAIGKNEVELTTQGEAHAAVARTAGMR